MAESTPKNYCYVIGETPRWQYKGEIKKCYKSEKKYAAFLGIPYAKKLKGNKRFQAPESLTTFEAINPGDETPTEESEVPTYEANVTGKFCTQSMRSPKYNFAGSMDCLYLNVFLPKDPKLIKELLPVLVYIHGGGFCFGKNDAEIYSPESIVQHGVVFVTINYRLGLLGFFNSHTEYCPGNAGLKDQVKALEWIRDNIKCFKGNPKNVTISGCSAGATCVNLHLIAPASKDLFHKAIVQSGGIYCTWGYRGHRYEQSNLLLKDSTFRALLHCPTDLNVFHVHAYHLLVEDRAARHPYSISPLFGPSREQYKEGCFITADVEEWFEKVDHKKPIMAGITKEEGLDQYVEMPNENYVEWVNDDQKFRKFLMDNLRWSRATAEKLAAEIRDKYFLDRSSLSDVDVKRHLMYLIRDISFHRFYDNFKFGTKKTVHENLYVYRFDHFSEISIAHDKRLLYREPTHEDELKYLYCPTSTKLDYEKYIYKGPNQNKSIQKVMNHICSLWANFCKSGTPKSDFDTENVKWDRHTEEKPCYLSISEDLKLVKEPLFKNEWKWLNERTSAAPRIPSPVKIT